MIEKRAFIFIVLVYKDYMDLIDLCNSLKENVADTFKVIIVDAFFDNETSAKVQEIAMHFECDYLPVENKGYGYGNNRGMDYAKEKYEYSWIVICNPDTILRSKLSSNKLECYKQIVAPRIVTKNRKHQNPYWAYENRLSEKLIFLGYKNRNRGFLYLGIGINKLLRYLFLLINLITAGKVRRIYACHGSFLIMRDEFANMFRYDESFFLFCEEACLAYDSKRERATTSYASEISVLHKEDGSMSVAEIDEKPLLKQAYLTYYRKYRLANIKRERLKD